MKNKMKMGKADEVDVDSEGAEEEDAEEVAEEESSTDTVEVTEGKFDSQFYI